VQKLLRTFLHSENPIQDVQTDLDSRRR